MEKNLKRSCVVLAVFACILFALTGESGAVPTATLRPLTTGSLFCVHGDWSPDGEWVVYSHQKPGHSETDIYKIRSDGTGAVQLTSGYYCDSKPQFSPNGNQIVFQRNKNPEGTRTLQHQASIWVMDADGTNQRQLVRPGAGEIGGAQTPLWSPDGKYIAYRYGESENKGIWVISADGKTGPQHIVAADFGEASEKYLDWNPIAFPRTIAVSIRVGSQNDSNTRTRHIAFVKFDPSRRRGPVMNTLWLTKSDRTGVNAKTCQWNMKWKNDGKTLVYTDDYNNRSDIWVMNSEGRGKVRLTDSAGNSNACYSDPNWSPNGEYIAYWSSEGLASTSTKRIYLMTADGNNKTCLMSDEKLKQSSRDGYLLHFNKSGEAILFTGHDSSNIVQLFVLDLHY